MSEKLCVICGSEFRASALNAEGKCSVCAKEHPNAISLEDALLQALPASARPVAAMTEEHVRALIDEAVTPELNMDVLVAQVLEKLNLAELIRQELQLANKPKVAGTTANSVSK